MSVVKTLKANWRDDETGVPVRLSPRPLPDFSEGEQSIQVLREKLTFSEADEQSGPRPRVVRASPFILISCGLIFLSLIFLLDFTAQTGQRDRQATESRTGSSNPEKNQAAPDVVRDSASPRNAPAREAKPSAQSAPAVIPSAEASARVGKENEESDKQPPAPASKTPAVSDVKAPEAISPPSPATDSKVGFTLQVGSYNDSAQAQERVAKLGSAGVSASVIRVEIPRRGTWYRVQTGSFKSREEATRFGAQLRAKGAAADFIVAAL